MAKKKKKRVAPNAAPSPKKASGSPKRSKYPLLALAIGAVLLIAGGFYFYQGRQASDMPAAGSIQAGQTHSGLHETRPTLPPAMFSGKVREAYTIAQQIPEVLDQLYCYCRCRENFGHKSLLSCYVDTHAST